MGAVAAFTLALWVPSRSGEAAVRRRIAGFVEGATGRPMKLAQDTGGRARWRGARRRQPAQEGSSGPWQFLERRLANAQLAVTPVEYTVVATAVTVVVLLGALVLTRGEPLAPLAAAAVPVVAILWLDWRSARIKARFRDQLADTVSLLASSVRTGHSVQVALEHVTQELPEPTRSAFSLVVREIGLGASMEEALIRLGERYPSDDLELLVTAVNVHSTIGGSLAKVLDQTAATIRERFRIAAEVKALTAQQRYAAYVLALLPVFTMVMLQIISPDYAKELFTGALRLAVIGAAVLVIVGFMIMKRMATIDD